MIFSLIVLKNTVHAEGWRPLEWSVVPPGYQVPEKPYISHEEYQWVKKQALDNYLIDKANWKRIHELPKKEDILYPWNIQNEINSGQLTSRQRFFDFYHLDYCLHPERVASANIKATLYYIKDVEDHINNLGVPMYTDGGLLCIRVQDALLSLYEDVSNHNAYSVKLLYAQLEVIAHQSNDKLLQHFLAFRVGLLDSPDTVNPLHLKTSVNYDAYELALSKYNR